MVAKKISDIPGARASVEINATIDELLGEALTIKEIHWAEGAFGPFAIVTAEKISGGVVTFATGGKVILRQLQKIEGQLPVIATIESGVSKVGRNYYYLA